VGRDARRLRALLEGNVALYSVHLPLDAHPEVGNNAILARDLGLSDTTPFGTEGGIEIGVAGRLEIDRAALAERLEAQLGSPPRLLAGGGERVARVAIVTGAGSSFLRQAREAGIDTFITGEGPHHTFFDAEEWGLNVFYAGHYATETLGVKALAQLAADRYGLEWEFMDYPTGM
jgi:dinuclear metal center YbgI/SA1388 family protein